MTLPDIAIESAKGSRELQTKMLDLTSEFLTELFYLSAEEMSKISENDLDSRLTSLEEKGIKLALTTSLPTSIQILQSVVTAGSLGKNEVSGIEKEELLKKYTESRAKLLVALYGEVARFRLQSIPNASKNEELMTLVQSLMM